jgi:hypothetical protein
MFTLIEKWLNFLDYGPKFGSFDPFKLFLYEGSFYLLDSSYQDDTITT